MTTSAKAKEAEEQQIPSILPILPSGDAVLFPAILVPLATSDARTVRLIDEAVGAEKIVGVFAEKTDQETSTPEVLFSVGTAATIVRMLKVPDGSVQVLFQGISRIRIVEIVQTQPYIKARVIPLLEHVEETTELQALARNLLSQFETVISLAPHLPRELGVAALNIPTPGSLADFVAANLNLSREEKQEILETLDVAERITKLTGYLNRELEILEIGSKIQQDIKTQMDKGQREYYLREQLKAIQRELGEGDQQSAEINEVRQKLDAANLPEIARKEAERELDRLSKMSPMSADYAVVRTYLDWMVALPWSKGTEDNLDIAQAARVLDEDHYDLEKVKDRILDYLAVRKIKKDMKGPILCFVGPPGVGKTSLGKSIARAMGRKFVRLSLGGVRDEAEIRGHRRTYVGALPGRILQELRRAESNNPVFMLDEVDKVGADFRGDPSAALLEVLDPEQNYTFSDHYLDIPFDLSKVMFITTANMADPIMPALRDRMETLELPGYTEEQKRHIAKRYLVPRQLAENGLTPDQLQFTDDALSSMIRRYTREAGVRNIEREIGTVCRRTARERALGHEELKVVTPDDVPYYLGPPRFRVELAEEEDEVGVATGLAWTPVGGEVLFVEVALVRGKGGLIITGKLGDVMQESARAALTYARGHASEYGDVSSDFYEKYDIHIHVPAGAIPKDGPSAGVTLTTALISAITKRPVRKQVGMTGEITLRGRVLPIGGIKEKTLAAHLAGLKKIIMPKENEKDLVDVPEDIRKDLEFVFVNTVDQVLREALVPKPELVKAQV
ncbi:MAG: endopeptidase La [Chloroflexi bacterium]|nr:endopeptidase La [Chloroflexota bacterium]